MIKDTSPRFGLGLQAASDRMKKTGLSELSTTVAQVAARLGARKVLAIHGATPEELQIEYKVEAAMTPRTVADLESGKKGKAVLRRWQPGITINEEETGLEEGREGKGRADYDPLDGTSSYALGQRYSTVGLSISDTSGRIKSSAIVNPFERELLVAEDGGGTWLFPLDDRLAIAGEGKELKVEQKTSFKGEIVYVDALFNEQTSDPKFGFMQDLLGLGVVGFRMTGSNIDQQQKVATGKANFGITDAKGGVFDLAPGGFGIVMAGGDMVDVQTGEVPTSKTEVVIYGSPELVRIALPYAQRRYENYKGFTAKAKKK